MKKGKERRRKEKTGVELFRDLMILEDKRRKEQQKGEEGSSEGRRVESRE